MNSFKDYIRKHIPETICISVTVCVFAVMSIYAVILYCEMVSQDKNTFNETVIPVTKTEIIEEESDSDAYDGEYYTVGNGMKYHVFDCSYVRNGNEVFKTSWSDIEEKGYEPCSRCIK